MLRAYTKNRLKRLRLAETHLKSLYAAAENRIFGELKEQRVSDFSYELYRNASPKDQEKILNEYFVRKVKGDVAIARAEEELIAESSVVPAAMELGMILLQHAQAQADPQARKALLNEAENTFLAVSRMAGDQAEYQFSLAQVYYWQGKHAEGRKLFDDVLKARNRDPALLLRGRQLTPRYRQQVRRPDFGRGRIQQSHGLPDQGQLRRAQRALERRCRGNHPLASSRTRMIPRSRRSLAAAWPTRRSTRGMSRRPSPT